MALTNMQILFQQLSTLHSALRFLAYTKQLVKVMKVKKKKKFNFCWHILQFPMVIKCISSHHENQPTTNSAKASKQTTTASEKKLSIPSVHDASLFINHYWFNHFVAVAGKHSLGSCCILLMFRICQTAFGSSIEGQGYRDSHLARRNGSAHVH